MKNQLVSIKTECGYVYHGETTGETDFYTAQVKITSKGHDDTDDEPFEIGKTYDIDREEIKFL